MAGPGEGVTGGLGSEPGGLGSEPGAPGAPAAGRVRSRRRRAWASVAAAVVVAAGLGLGLGLGLTGGPGSTGGGTGSTTRAASGTTTSGGAPATSSTPAGGRPAAGRPAGAGPSAAGPRGPMVLVPGTYVAGHPGEPHYVLGLTGTEPDALAGSVAFVYQDGSSTTVLTFVGMAAGRQATLHPAVVGQRPGHGAGPVAEVPATVTADLGTQAVDLPGCAGYLRFARTPADCAFTLDRGGAG